MSKNGKKGQALDPVVTCSSGIAVVTRPISIKLLELFEKNHREPEPPMREAEIVGGGVDLVPDLENPEYLEAKKEFNRKSTDDFLAMILELGVTVEMPNDNLWMKSLRRAGVDIPEDPDDQRMLYIQTIVMPNYLSDLSIIAASVLRQSGVEEEAIQSWVSLF